jgi:SNF2 family DNA or RNA helicase
MDEALSIPADHVFFLHPMVNNAEEEIMNVVRPVRPGGEVHVHRFVTTGTVEENLFQHHSTQVRAQPLAQPQMLQATVD